MMSGRSGAGMPEFLSVLRNCMLDIRSELEEEISASEEDQQLHESIPSMIDKAIVEIKTKNETIAKMEDDMKQLMSENRLLSEAKSQAQSLEVKHNQKVEEIAILRDTIKTLNQENERMNKEKTELSKEAVASKEALASLKKKYKRQEEQIGGYKGDIRKATQMAEERLDEYIKSDQQKQQQIKGLTAENDKLKTELARKERHLASANKKLDELKEFQRICEESSIALEALQHDKKAVVQQLDVLREKYHSEKRKLLEQNESLLKEIEKLNDRADRQVQEHRQAHLNASELADKCSKYEQEIMTRTDKIKEKNRQIKLFTEELGKMQQKVEQLSKMAEHLMEENDVLKKETAQLQQRNEQFRQFYAQLGRLKGEMHSKKESELIKLTDSLEKLARLNYA